MKNISSSKHVRQLSVALGGTLVGSISLANDGKIWFEYLPEWVANGFNLSRFMGFDSKAQLAKDVLFGGLHGVFANSLPDGWGLLLMDREFKRRFNWDPHAITPLDRLAYIGARGMGALEYAPIYEQDAFSNQVDLGELARSVDAVLQGKEGDVLHQLKIQGGSPGGARPKVTIARSKLSEICLSGFEALPDDYTHWLVKFRSPDDPKDMGRIEKAYAEMAGNAGIVMPTTELIAVSQGKQKDDFFAVERFDRYGKNGKMHTHSLAGLLYANFKTPCMDYDGVLRSVRMVTNDYSQVVNAFRLMVFNVLTHNQDDHVKNFVFVHDDLKGWQLSPAFDLTYSTGIGNQHTTAINGAGEPTLGDVLKIGKNHSIYEALKIVGEVRFAVSKWSSMGHKWGASKKSISQIQQACAKIDNGFSQVSLCEFNQDDINPDAKP